MSAPPERPRSAVLTWALLLAGIGLLVVGQFLYLQSASAVSAATIEGARPIPPLVAFVADDVVAPALRALGDPDPAPARVALWLRYTNVAGMLLGLVLVVLGGRRLQLARQRTRR